jgi:sRNA-binding protein
MKKVALVLIAIAFVAGIAFAQDQVPPANKMINESKKVASDTKAAVVTLTNVTLAEPAKGLANSTITVSDETGKAANYTVTQSTKILGATLDVLTLNQLKIGDKIKIKSKEGTQEASAIKVIK